MRIEGIDTGMDNMESSYNGETDPSGKGWTYIGEGEWIHMGKEIPQKKQEIQQEGTAGTKWLRTLDKDIDLHYKVLEGG